jgi:uncharacterized protein YueI
MKKTLVSLSALLALSSCGPTTNDAVKYNDSIIDWVDHVKEPQEKLIDQLDGHNIDSLKITQLAFANASEESSKALEGIKAFDDKTEYLDAAKKFIMEIKSLSDNEVKSLANVLMKDSLSISEEDVKIAEKSWVSFDSKYEKAFNEFAEAQKQFAVKWNFKLMYDKK